MNLTLSNVEQADFDRYILPVIKAAPAGTFWHFRDFFPGRTASLRLSRYLYEQTSQGNLSLRLSGKYSEDGYIKI